MHRRDVPLLTAAERLAGNICRKIARATLRGLAINRGASAHQHEITCRSRPFSARHILTYRRDHSTRGSGRFRTAPTGRHLHRSRTETGVTAAPSRLRSGTRPRRETTNGTEPWAGVQLRTAAAGDTKGTSGPERGHNRYRAGRVQGCTWAGIRFGSNPHKRDFDSRQTERERPKLLDSKPQNLFLKRNFMALIRFGL